MLVSLAVEDTSRVYDCNSMRLRCHGHSGHRDAYLRRRLFLRHFHSQLVRLNTPVLVMVMLLLVMGTVMLVVIILLLLTPLLPVVPLLLLIQLMHLILSLLLFPFSLSLMLLLLLLCPLALQ